MSDFNCETFLRGWADAIKKVLNGISGTPCDLNFASPSKPVAGESSCAWIGFRCSGSLEGGAAFCLSLDDAIQLAGIALGQATESTNELSAALLDALQKLFRQFAGAVAPAMQSNLGGELELHFEGGGKPEWVPGATASLSVRLANGKLFHIAAITNAQRVHAELAANSEAGKVEASNENLELLREVKLDVTLRFGKKQLLLKDVLALDTGAVIELDQQIEAAVDLLLGERVIARGDVVVVDGNYGLRVTEVIH